MINTGGRHVPADELSAGAVFDSLLSTVMRSVAILSTIFGVGAVDDGSGTFFATPGAHVGSMKSNMLWARRPSYAAGGLFSASRSSIYRR